ncbi:MFS transporter [Bacillus sp. C1-1]|nr:MFS transporter [Bacillus sp. C1-1]
MKSWKQPALLLTTTGLSAIGDFIYLIVMNILVFQLTGSAVAVAGFWIISPLVNIVTKFWTGSFIDYRSKRQIMMATYIIRAIGIALIPFAPTMFAIYVILVGLSVSQSFFFPASLTYTTMLVPMENRKRFNAIRAFVSSSAFIIGPAIGGALILLFSTSVTLWINACLFLLAFALLTCLPEERKGDIQTKPPRLTLALIKSDVMVVFSFVKKQSYVMGIYIAFQVTFLFSFPMDVQEVVFIQNAVGLSELDYSLLVSITGIGACGSAILLSVFANRFPLRWMIASGMVFTTLGYVLYAVSWSFTSIAIGFVILGFFNVIVNAGMTTFYQNHVPVTMMGRVTSMVQLGQSIGQVFLVIVTGITIDMLSLRTTIVALSLFMTIVAIGFAIQVLRKKHRRYFIKQEIVNRA